MVSVDVKHHAYLLTLGGILSEDVPLVEFMYLAFTRMAGESYTVGDSGLRCVRVTSVEH